MNETRRTRGRAKGRPPRTYRLTDAEGDVFMLEGAALVARVLGVAKQTVYNCVCSGKKVAGRRIERASGGK